MKPMHGPHEEDPGGKAQGRLAAGGGLVQGGAMNRIATLRQLFVSPGHNYFGHHGRAPSEHVTRAVVPSLLPGRMPLGRLPAHLTFMPGSAEAPYRE